MPDEKTAADALRVYLTGAGSDGGAQAAPLSAFGGYRSSTGWQPIGFATSPVTNLTLDFVSGNNGEGNGTLAAASADTVTWTAPGESAGTAVTIANGETKIVESGGGDRKKFVRVTRTSASAMSGSGTVALADVFNNIVGGANWTGAEATSGEDKYLCLAVKNEHPTISLTACKVTIGTLGTQQTSDGGDLDASGAGTITTTGSFATWPEAGWCQIRTAAGAMRETVYYSERTDTVLTVPAAGRAQLGTTAAAGTGTDTLDAVPPIRLAEEQPTGDSSTGSAQTIANITTAPATIGSGTVSDWSHATDPSQSDALVIGTSGELPIDDIWFVWLHSQIPAGAIADAELQKFINFQYDSA